MNQRNRFIAIIIIISLVSGCLHLDTVREEPKSISKKVTSFTTAQRANCDISTAQSAIKPDNQYGQ